MYCVTHTYLARRVNLLNILQFLRLETCTLFMGTCLFFFFRPELIDYRTVSASSRVGYKWVLDINQNVLLTLKLSFDYRWPGFDSDARRFIIATHDPFSSRLDLDT